ncbi:hypothetical protein BHE74_00048079, partial [Ensete ventricosum]
RYNSAVGTANSNSNGPQEETLSIERRGGEETPTIWTLSATFFDMEMVDERAEEAKPEVVLVARKGGFGLPTACPVCLPVYCHLRFANVDFKLEFDRANPDSGTSIFAASLPLLPLFWFSLVRSFTLVGPVEPTNAVIYTASTLILLISNRDYAAISLLPLPHSLLLPLCSPPLLLFATSLLSLLFAAGTAVAGLHRRRCSRCSSLLLLPPLVVVATATRRCWLSLSVKSTQLVALFLLLTVVH